MSTATAPRESLFKLTEDMLHLETLLGNGDIDEQTYADTLDAYLKDATAAKLEAYCRLIRERDARAKARADEKKWLGELQKADENTVKALKTGIQRHLEALGKGSAAAGMFTVAIQANGGLQALEVDTAVAEDPTLAVDGERQFYDLVPTLRNDLIRCAIEEGRDLPWARLLPRGKGVRIR